MRYEILLAPTAVQDLARLRANQRSAVKKAIEEHLRHEPEKTSKSRIKKLRGMTQPQYRLRIDDVRVFYDVNDGTVEILAIVKKPHAEKWLAEFGLPETANGENGDEESGAV